MSHMILHIDTQLRLLAGGGGGIVNYKTAPLLIAGGYVSLSYEPCD